MRPAEAILSFEGMDSPAQLRALAQRMQSGSVPMLMVRGANPAYTMPKSSGFAAAMAKVPFKVSFSSVPDETTAMADLILPDHHSLEQWGDAEPVRGTISLQQPTMDPVFDTRATADVLLSISSPPAAGTVPEPGSAYRKWLIARIPGGASALAAALPKGVMPGTLGRRRPRRDTASDSIAPTIGQTTGDFYLMVYPHPLLGMGAGANKPWLQEIPDPVTKICWQTVVEMHPATAEKLGVKNGDHVTVQTAAGSITAPALTYIGIRPDTVAIAAGRGHVGAGRYAKAGVNAFDLLPYVEDRAGSVSLVVDESESHGRVRTLAHRDDRRLSEAARPRNRRRRFTVAETGTGEHAEHAEKHEPEFPGDASHEFLPGLRSPVANDAQGDRGDPNSRDKGMYDPNHWSGMANRRWAMTVDLARCTGCAACVTACYAENNIPTVGADWQVGRVFSPIAPASARTSRAAARWRGSGSSDTTRAGKTAAPISTRASCR